MPKRDAPPNKELKLTKPSKMELRSLTPVLGAPLREPRELTARLVAAIKYRWC